ncbi:hypothetical protein EN836_27805 [Mesorhizobium sp. M1C.F.Ca.ET.193.01.1.1]|uniref:hypothetical protein n=1 Tax=unclassified Mesorhizobium TaxID=325217 RepID=UPI000FD57421|nr:MULTISPECIES: hypothetical protein [unclassified Mesorhizobium]TGS93409.1 hypothetical protein EN820_48470 [bacterium M00.F.Ca.ET.177.01.1.1]TGQ50697.1 hypothetical protein EN853_27800 [Mesorhizobium sp. M1C.F.Ca.ET.210.01.1.1]TGQ65863.1 hypothetical protein EN855_027810 [Mesorhizobium sp. M1C.F.Ca.ET.212.01.1.1]TGQ99868.1 hypothetical protein EN847_27800 [Mesorhizobium sp. M1C.F.Ca.ET.204.01.1.1]TGR20401.1 hypothetical protein EN839_27800 [Mesorhizobium sp. M1C.F.Ca.ET.196.01.1.1]
MLIEKAPRYLRPLERASAILDFIDHVSIARRANHRFGLDDAKLNEDNHIATLANARSFRGPLWRDSAAADRTRLGGAIAPRQIASQGLAGQERWLRCRQSWSAPHRGADALWLQAGSRISIQKLSARADCVPAF